MENKTFGESSIMKSCEEIDKRGSAACGFALWTSCVKTYFPLQGGVFFVTDADGVVVDLFGLDGVHAVPELPELVPGARLCGVDQLNIREIRTCELVPADGDGEPRLVLRETEDRRRSPGCMLVPLQHDDAERMAVLGFYTADERTASEMTPFTLRSCAFALHACILSAERELKMKEAHEARSGEYSLEAKKQEALLEILRKVQINMDAGAVLTEVMGSMETLFPDARFDLYLSQDENVPEGLAAKPMLFYGSEPDLCTRAFMTNRLLTERSEDGSFHLAAPLSGKQGVYGVLRIKSPAGLTPSDVRFITMIADSAGSAFENAKLYMQSNMMINELRIINEITRRLNQSLKLNEIFNYAYRELLQVFRAEYACILKIDAESKQMTVQAGNLPEIMNEVFATDYGFSGIVYASQEPVIISDYWNSPKVHSKFMELTRARSLLASPISVGNEVVGIVLVAHSEPNFFSYDNFKLLRVLSGHIGLAISNATLHAEVRRMVITDQLTGLYTRRYLDEQIGAMQKTDYCGSIILLDIDHFKKVNDTYGHQVGDEVLKQVSEIIRTSIRDADIAARWGGEELAIYLPLTRIDQAYRVADRILGRIRSETNPQVTASCGIAEWNWEDRKISVEQLFYVADMNMYRAKEDGRDQIQMRHLDEKG